MAQYIITIIVAIIGSNGLWSCLQAFFARRREKKKGKKPDIAAMMQKQNEIIEKQNDTVERQKDMILGLGHDRIVFLGSKYLEQGYITKEQYEDLNEYLYQPYLKLGGNGTAKKVMSEVEKLPMR